MKEEARETEQTITWAFSPEIVHEAAPTSAGLPPWCVHGPGDTAAAAEHTRPPMWDTTALGAAAFGAALVVVALLLL